MFRTILLLLSGFFVGRGVALSYYGDYNQAIVLLILGHMTMTVSIGTSIIAKCKEEAQKTRDIIDSLCPDSIRVIDDGK
jgi:hypothetical protein